jgi:hypothetical protein
MRQEELLKITYEALDENSQIIAIKDGMLEAAKQGETNYKGRIEPEYLLFDEDAFVSYFSDLGYYVRTEYSERKGLKFFIGWSNLIYEN